MDLPLPRSLCRLCFSSGSGTQPLGGRTSLSIRSDPRGEYGPKAYGKDREDEHDDLGIHRRDDELKD